MRTAVLLLACLTLAPMLCAAEESALPDPPPEGSVTREEGLAAWARIYEVTTHPRCANCHVGEDHVPMWSGPSYGSTRKHGMNIQAGESRIGAETLPCSTCHAYRETLNDTPHAAPQIPGDWRLPPVEAEWFGKSSAEVCAQLRDPARNGARDYMALAEHAGHDALLTWAWSPGGGREPAPFSQEAHVEDILIWGVAGQPCETDE